MTDYLDYYKDKIILVTGGAGAIGSNLVRKLSDIDTKLIIVMDNLSSSYEWNLPSRPNVMFVKGDITNETDLKRVFQENPQIVFHLAAFFANQNSIDFPEKDLWTNGYGILKVLEYSVLKGIEKLIYASSGCAIYGAEAPLPLKEEFISLHLSSPYQITKSLGEMYCNFFHHHYELPVVKPRFFNSYGPGEVPGQYRNVIPNFIYWAIKGKTLPITGTGEESRDFTYVMDLVDGLLRAGYYDKAVGKEFNLASAKETRIIDLANMVNKEVNNKGGIKFLSARKWDTKPRLLASIDRAKKLIRYQPKIEFDEGLKETIKWFYDNWDMIDKCAEFGPGISSAVRE